MVTTRRNSDDDVPNFEAMINAAVANALPNLTAALRTQITNDIRNGVGSSGGGGGDAIPPGIHVWIERFTKLKPLAFRSAATPAEAEDWITHMEKLFQVLGCPDNFKTRLAAFKLEGDALSWWKAHLRTQVGGDAFADTCTWVAFREIFYNRYFPASEQQRYEREYGSICQLDRENSGEYMERFTRLASFVGATAGDAQRQARHFKWGLKKWVLDRIVNTDYTNVAQVAAAARNIELLHESGNSNKRDRDGNRIQNRGQGQQENKGRYDQGQHEYRGRQDQSVEHRGRQDRGYDSKRQDFRGQDQRFTGRNGNDRQGQGNYNQRQHRNQSTRDFNQGHASGSAGQRRSTETLPPPPLCTTCGKPHPGVCYKATGGCFTCGSTQHKVKDCPQGKQKQSMPADFARLPPTTGRVYATTRDQAAKTSGTITGILYIDDRTVFVLFDTGATHSIISTTFAKKLNMTPTPLIERVIISTPMKNHMLIDHEYVNCPLRFDDRIRPANFFTKLQILLLLRKKKKERRTLTEPPKRDERILYYPLEDNPKIQAFRSRLEESPKAFRDSPENNTTSTLQLILVVRQLILEVPKKDVLKLYSHARRTVTAQATQVWVLEILPHGMNLNAFDEKQFQMSSWGNSQFFLVYQSYITRWNTSSLKTRRAEILNQILIWLNVKAAITPMETKVPLTKDEESFDVDVTPKTFSISMLSKDSLSISRATNLGLWYPRESPFDLEAFSDSDYGGSNLDRKSTTGGCQFLGQRLISWQYAINLADRVHMPNHLVGFFDAVVQLTMWFLWRFQNDMSFSFKRPSKDLILNDIKLASYKWISSRVRTVRLNWIEWFDNPCNTYCN
ncbi:zinc finger, CCHC-type, retrotransposon gag domain protein [Tanacetum coccineum]